MKPIPLLCFVALAALLQTATACFNISGVALDGDEVKLEYADAWSRDNLTSGGKPKEYWEERLAELETKMSGNPTLQDRSDYGGVLAHLGQFEKARQVLEAAEAAESGDYAVASNLGTTYELLGDNVKALEWIKKGLERNPKAHGGTEWVHVKILEAKMALADDPKWLESHTVLGAHFGTKPRPALVAYYYEDRTRPPGYLLTRGIGHQLRERLQFVKPPDPLVGELIFELANAMAVFADIKRAVSVYELAQEYEAPHNELITQRIKYLRGVLARAAAKKPAKQ